MTDWQRIKQDYEQGQFSQSALAKKHGVSRTAIQKKAMKESWQVAGCRVASQAALCYNGGIQLLTGAMLETSARLRQTCNGGSSMDSLYPDSANDNPLPLTQRSPRPFQSPWNAIRVDYEQGQLSQSVIAKKYDISRTAIQKRAAKEQWCQPEKKTESAYSTYALIDPRDHLVRYVGMSRNVRKRFGQHLIMQGESNTAKAAWILDLWADTLLPVLSVLETDLTFDDAVQREKYWIAYFAYSLDMPLVNHEAYGNIKGVG